jgi:hypothetical protein
MRSEFNGLLEIRRRKTDGVKAWVRLIEFYLFYSRWLLNANSRKDILLVWPLTFLSFSPLVLILRLLWVDSLFSLVGTPLFLSIVLLFTRRKKDRPYLANCEVFC